MTDVADLTWAVRELAELSLKSSTSMSCGIAHANGSHQSRGIEIDPVTGTPSLTRHASLYRWPE